jgi:hypothetical protein
LKEKEMISIFGFIGFLVCLLIALPASLIAFINVFKQPANEIIKLWLTLIDLIIDIIDSIKKQIQRLN